MDRPDAITANRGDVGFLPSRTLIITLLLSLLFLLSACQLPFIASDTEDSIEEVQTPTTGEEGAAEEGESSIFEAATPATGAAEESAEGGDGSAEDEEPSPAPEATENVEETEDGAAEEGAAEGSEGAAEGSEGAAEGSEGAGEGSEGAAEGSEGAAEGSEGAAEGSEGAGEGSEGAAEGSEGAAEGSEGAAEGSEGAAEGSEGAAEGSEGAAEGSEGAAEGSEGATEGSEGTAEGSEGTAEGSEGTAEGSEGTAEGSEGAAEGSEGAAEGSEGAAEGSEGAAEGSEGAEESAGGTAEAASNSSSTPQVQITADTVNVHDGPGPYNPVVGSLTKGNIVEVIGRNLGATWFYVKVSDTLDAWVVAESTQGVGAFSANELPVLKAPAIPAPTAMPEPTATTESAPAATATTESAPAATATTESAPVATATTESAPVATPIAQSGDFLYGIQAHLVHIDRSLPFANTTGLGFGLIKQQIEWKEWEPTQGDINWGEMDAIVQEAQQNNLQVLYSVVGAPDWAREAGFDGSVAGPPADPATFASFLSQMATRYCGQNLRAIEVWNEQNLHYEWGNQTLDPAAYMALLKPSYDAIKAACPSMTVISGALTPAGDIGTLAIDDFTYLQGMFDNGLANAADAVGAHPSGYNVPPSLRYTEACAHLEQKTPAPTFKGPCDTPHHSWSFLSTLEGYQAIIQQNSSNQKIWATEFGWAAGGSFAAGYEYADDNSLDEQAAWSVEAYQYMRDSGYVEAGVLWNLNFRMVADGTEKAQWGILANNSQPLPAFISLQAMQK